MIKKTIYSLCFVSVLFTLASSQNAFAQRTITGKVVNSEDGQCMTGVAVTVKETTIGTSTDSVGNFVLRVPDNATIVASFMGFKTVEISAGNKTRLDITLQLDAISLGNVVVKGARRVPSGKVETAFGIQRDKKKLTYSVQTVLGDEIRRAGDTDLINSLRGKIAGLEFFVDNSAQGAGRETIARIRGAKSLSGSNPLCVIDGVPIAGGISHINIHDVESVTILKSANSAILYGSAGANGVILITTKPPNFSRNIVSQGPSSQRTIIGKVISGEDGHGMSRISVIVKGSTIETLTDMDGNFTLKVPNDTTIVVSYTGFKTVETPVEKDKTWYEITLPPGI